MEFETLLYEVEDGVLTLTLNRPEHLNAFNYKMAAELQQAWQHIKKDPEVVCVIVTGAGDRALCTGFDVSDGVDRKNTRPSYEESPLLQLTAIHNRCWKPVITAVNGMVNGGGLHFIADSDIILAADHASFFDTHVKVGMVAGLEPVGLARRIPLEAVFRMAYTGGKLRLSAQEAKELGLVGEVLPLADLMPRAREIAGMISQHSPAALARTKRAIWESLNRGLYDGLVHTWSIIGEQGSSPDMKEGSLAYMEKRKPRWAPYREE